MDDFQARAARSLRTRHERVILADARRIQEYIGYVLAGIEGGSTTSVGRYARDIAVQAHEIESRAAVLEGIAEVTGILGTGEPAAERLS